MSIKGTQCRKCCACKTRECPQGSLATQPAKQKFDYKPFVTPLISPVLTYLLANDNLSKALEWITVHAHRFYS